MLIKCQVCGFTGTFYLEDKETKKSVKITDSMKRINRDRGAIALYAHEHCLKGLE